jgi:RNA polymerase sigma-70 factor (ECF subfamily)
VIETDIVARVRAGDVDAFETLYTTYATPLWRFAYRFVRSGDVAHDIVQDVFCAVWANRAEWAVHTTIRGYLYGAVRNHALAHQRREHTTAKVYDAAMHGDRGAAMSTPPRSPHETLVANDSARSLQTAVRKLPERQRIAFTLWWDDFTLAEIADVMEISTVAAWKLVTKARQRLAAALREV